MTLLSLFSFFLYALVLGSVPSNVSRPLSAIADDDFALNEQNKISATASLTSELLTEETPAVEALSTEVYFATHINPTQTDCRTDCAVGLPAATVYKWQKVTITSTTTVQTVTHIVNPQSFPNVTGTVRSYQYPENPDEAKRDRYSLDKEDGVVVTSLDLGYKTLPVTFPTPVTVTPTTLTLVGGPPATISQEAPACTPAVVQSVNLTILENPKLFAFGDIGSIDKAASEDSNIPPPSNKALRDTVHWRLVPEYYRQVDVGQFRNQFPYIMALDICGAFGPPDQRASVTQLTGNAWATVTVTSTVSGSKDPRVNPLIYLTKRPGGTTLDGPGARQTEEMAEPFTVHQEHSAQEMTSPTQISGIALPQVTEAPSPDIITSGELVGPAPKPAPILDQIESGGLLGSLTKPSRKPAIGGQNSGTSMKAAPLMVNGHTLTPKGEGTWEADDGQVLRVGGPQIELDNSSHGDGHKMKVGLNRGSGGRNVLVVDGASMTLAGDDFTPMATGSSRSGGRGRGGNTKGIGGGSSGMPLDSDSGMEASGQSLAQYTGSAQRVSLRWTLSLAVGVFGVILFL